MDAPRLANTQKRRTSKRKTTNDGLKVVYISSPMKVKTSAAKFRSLVQQLTGKNSDISQYMEDGDTFSNFREIDWDDEQSAHTRNLNRNRNQNLNRNRNHHVIPSISPVDTPTSSDSFLDGVFVPQMEEPFAGFFDSDLYSYPSELELLQMHFDF